jgi:integrase
MVGESIRRGDAMRKRDNRQGGLFIETKRDPKTRKRVHKSESWVAQYYVDGKRFRKSTGTSVKVEAEAKLREWMGASERGEKAKPQTQGLTYADLRRDLLVYYAERQHKSLKTKKDGTPYLFPLTALDNFFNGRRVNHIDRETASAFVANRRKAGKSNSTINNSVRLLIRMFSLARDNGKLTAVPKFELPKTKSRQGFLPPEQFQKLFDAMPTNLQPMLLLLYHSGVRVGEAERIEWSAVNLDAATITLLEGETKNDESRILPLSDSLVTLLSRVKLREGRVFPSKRAMQAAFPKACAAAKIKGLMVHDLRRSAVRNLMHADVQQAVAMKISGHRDATVFQRYNIVDANQTTDAMPRVQRLAPVKVHRLLPVRSARRGGSR